MRSFGGVGEEPANHTFYTSGGVFQEGFLSYFYSSRQLSSGSGRTSRRRTKNCIPNKLEMGVSDTVRQHEDSAWCLRAINTRAPKSNKNSVCSVRYPSVSLRYCIFEGCHSGHGICTPRSLLACFFLLFCVIWLFTLRPCVWLPPAAAVCRNYHAHVQLNCSVINSVCRIDSIPFLWLWCELLQVNQVKKKKPHIFSCSYFVSNLLELFTLQAWEFAHYWL